MGKKKKKIQVGPGRGSSSGSLVSFLLGITDVDPVKNKLLFERFLSNNKNCFPDFDVDFAPDDRNKVINYIKKKYGKNNVINIVTFGKFSIKVSIKDIGRIFNISYRKTEQISNLILCKKELDNKSKKIFSISKGLEKRIRNLGIHAGGIIIFKSKNILPIFYINKGSGEYVKVSQFDKCDIEYLGYLKFDILGLKTLNVVRDIKKYSNFCKDFSEIDIKNKKVFSMISKGKTNGVFQLESFGIRKLLNKIKPKVFQDLVSILALYRPGPLFLIEEFCKRRENVKEVKYMSRGIKKILRDTYGLIIFQEQITKILTECFNIDINIAEEIRKQISKKLFNKNIKNYLLKKIKQDYYEKKEEIFNILIKYSGYSFNKSHAVSYAMLTYYMAYLKEKFFNAFFLSNINNFILDKKKALLLEEAQREGLIFLKVSLNNSEFKFKDTKEGVLFGYNIIKNFGIKAYNYIFEERKKKKYEDFYDFFYRIDRCIVNKRKIESLIFSNVFSYSIRKKNEYLNFIKRNKGNNMYQMRIFSYKEIKDTDINKNKKYFMKKEYEHLGYFIIDPITKFIKEINLNILKVMRKKKYRFIYYGYVSKIFEKNNIYILYIVRKHIEKSFIIYKNIIKKISILDIVILFGHIYNNKICIRKIKKI
ncbi:DNA polymerase III subunit alpha [Candidatus Vidania fulgoroideorum]